MSLLFEQTIRLSQIARSKPIVIVHEDVDCLDGTNEERKKTHVGFTPLNWFRDGKGGKKLTSPPNSGDKALVIKESRKNRKTHKRASDTPAACQDRLHVIGAAGGLRELSEAGNRPERKVVAC